MNMWASERKNDYLILQLTHLLFYGRKLRFDGMEEKFICITEVKN